MNTTLKNLSKEHSLYIFLLSLFLTNALVAEMVGVKMFSLENTLGFKSLDWPFFNGMRLNLNMSVGILMWPIVFILSDIVNEYFGVTGVRKMSFLGAGLIAYAFLIIFVSTNLHPADFWLQVNSTDSHGRPFDINYAYSTIFRQGLGIIIGSITAFLVGQLVDMYIFHYLRKLTNHKMLWLRSTGSTVVSQFVDSYLILIIAFYLLGNWSLTQVLAVGTIQYLYKVTLAVVLTPVIYWMHFIIDRYLGRAESQKLIEKAKDI